MSPRAVLLSLLLLLCALPGRAESAYYFSVPSVDMTVRIQPDASVQVEYDIEFLNQASGQAIDIVDIGMPNADYDIRSMAALVNGTPLSGIRNSEFVKPGVEVHLGPRAIRSGQSGSFTLRYTHEDLVFSDQTDDALASFRITPTWFGQQYVAGVTDLKVAIVLPPGVKPEQVLHQGLAEFASKAVTGEGTVVLFRWENTRFTQAHLVGISFPRSAMERVVTFSKWQLLVKAVEGNSELRVGLFVVLALLLGIAFFRFSGGTGFVVYLALAGGAAFVSMNSAAFQILAIPGGLVLVAANEAFLRKRKSDYLPPIAQVEGGGIKRGLTAPEAAVMLEMPLGKVLSLVIFGLLKKGVLRVESDKPFAVSITEAFDLRGTTGRSRPAERKKRARDAGVAMRKYEEEFLQSLEDTKRGAALTRVDFKDALKRLVTITADRLAGFDLSDTQDYYRKIIERALIEARSTVPETEEAESTMDRSLEWILLSERPGDVFDHYRYRPPWRRRGGYYGGGVGGGGGGLNIPKPSGGDGWSPSVGDAAGGYAGWAGNVFGDLAGAILPGDVSGKGGGFLDLSGVDKVTGEVLKAMAENSGNGGGGGGGGCACAGCACACACAGGGR